MEIIRNYSHKVHGAIGKVTFVAPDGTFTLDGKELPAASVEHLLTFALQTLQDAYAGSKNTDEAQADFAKKYDKLIAGTIGTRSGGDGATEETRVARSIARELFKAKVGGKSEAWAAFTGLSDADQIARLDAIVAKNAALIAPKVAEKIAAIKAEREAKAGLVDVFAI